MMLILALLLNTDVILSVRPRMGQAPLGVTLTVRIPEPTEQNNCPALTLELYGNGELISRSTTQSDCNPESREPFYFYRVYGLQKGEWLFSVTLKQGKWERKLEQTVEVL